MSRHSPRVPSLLHSPSDSPPRPLLIFICIILPSYLLWSLSFCCFFLTFLPHLFKPKLSHYLLCLFFSFAFSHSTFFTALFFPLLASDLIIFLSLTPHPSPHLFLLSSVKFGEEFGCYYYYYYYYYFTRTISNCLLLANPFPLFLCPFISAHYFSSYSLPRPLSVPYIHFYSFSKSSFQAFSFHPDTEICDVTDSIPASKPANLHFKSWHLFHGFLK
jgi:hypothetical protein